jgi:transposase
VKVARELAETTLLTRREIAARVGVSHMTITRWARSGGWIPLGWRRGGGFPARSWDAIERASLHSDPWARLNEAERLLDALERQDRASLDDLERALTLLLLARREHAQPQRPGRNRRSETSNPL